MFGKPRELSDTTHLDDSIVGDFFGDESAAAEVVRVDELHHRVAQVESQINSQFTSLATYAQIAQEQIELTRAESRAATERSEHRLTELIERERADRIDATEQSNPGVVNIGAARSAMDERLDALERSVAQIKVTLDECFAQQLALASAIHKLFEHQMVPAASHETLVDARVEAAPPVADVTVMENEITVNDVTFDEAVELAASAPAPRSFAPPVATESIPGLSLRLDIA